MATADDVEIVKTLLGREPQGEFEVVVRREDSTPVVIKNMPIQFGGRPMPTLYWLVDPQLLKSIGRLESTGAVDQVEEEIGLDKISQIHERYEQERETLIQSIDLAPDAPRPSGGVGGTRRGVKCLHAHYANLLAGANDEVGLWVAAKLEDMRQAYDPTQPGLVTELSDAV